MITFYPMPMPIISPSGSGLISGHELGAIFLIVAAIASYFALVIWLSVYVFDRAIVFVVGLILPLVVAGLILFF